jgi:hypothetical protein
MTKRQTSGRPGDAERSPSDTGRASQPMCVSWTPARRRDPATVRVLALATRLAREVGIGETSPQQASDRLPGPWHDLVPGSNSPAIILPAGAGYQIRQGFVVAGPALVHRVAGVWVLSDWASGFEAPWGSALRYMRVAAPWVVRVLGVHRQARIRSSLYVRPEGVRLSRAISVEDLRAGEWAARLGLLAERECRAAQHCSRAVPPPES